MIFLGKVGHLRHIIVFLPGIWHCFRQREGQRIASAHTVGMCNDLLLLLKGGSNRIWGASSYYKNINHALFTVTVLFWLKKALLPWLELTWSCSLPPHLELPVIMER